MFQQQHHHSLDDHIPAQRR